MPEMYKKRSIREINAKTDLLRLNNELYLKELKSTFDSIRMPSVYYSLNGYSEDAVCIEHNDNIWMVYNGERGNKYNIKEYKNIKEACDNLILRLSESEEEQKQIQNIFENKLKEYKKQTAIKNIYAKTSGGIGLLEVKIVVLTAKIKEITEYLKANPNDYHSRKDLLDMVSQRRGLLDYLKKTDLESYRYLIDRLGIKL